MVFLNDSANGYKEGPADAEGSTLFGILMAMTSLLLVNFI